MTRCILLLIGFAFATSELPAFEEPTAYSVGIAAEDVTPAFPIRLNGFGGRTKESEGVRQQLWAKALAVGTSEQDTVVVITVDTLGIPDDLTERIAQKLKAKGLDRSRLAICASHTHSGPMIRNCANTLFGKPIPEEHWQNILKYSEQLEASLEKVALAALADRKPAHLSWGIGKVGFAFNRRTKGGPVDHDLPLLAVRDLDGKLRAVFTNYACHCVTLSDDMISGDWAGYAMDHIQRRNPDCQAMISIGCGADSNPRGGVLGSKFDVADSLGQEIAEDVQRLLSTELKPLSQAPVSHVERVTLSLAPLPTREQWEERANADNAIGHHARTQLARLDRGEALMTEISYSIQSVAFGNELAWVFLPGEVVVDYALRMKQELDGGRIWMNAYSNGCPGYVPSERILREGGYEGGSAMVYYDIPGAYATGLEQTIVTTINGQLKENFAPAVDVAKTNGIRPLATAEALTTLRTKPGYHAELVAAEPLIESPVAISFGPDGKLWVAEMNDYPQGRANGESGGQIRCLTDNDGDGKYDRSDVFLTGIPFPTGVTVWRKGVLVCAAPDILYAEDTNGDGTADEITKLFTGFATHNYQARVNSLEYGLDGWVYGSCGLFGGEITNVRTGKVIALGQRDFRFKPDTGIFEAASGATQQGRVRNDWGDWFGCNNGTLLMHYPLASHYLQRNPYLAASQSVVGIAAGPDPGRLFSISEQVLFMLSGPPNRPTAACGLGIYRDDLLGSGYSENAFTCEPVNNLVHRQILMPSSASFTGRRDDDEQDREFLASTDPWFRPVQVRTGADGALWVVDMYRYVIEHPIWIPPDTLATLDPRAGSTMGRIYRIVKDDQPARSIVRLDQLKGQRLAAAMETANGTQRDLVQQLIQWNKDTEAIAELQRICLSSSHSQVRIQALSTLANMDAFSIDGLSHLLQDSDPHVRRHAVRVSESLLTQSAAIASLVEQLATDSDPQVRLQVAYSAGFMEPGDAGRTLAKLMTSEPADSHLMSGIESSLTAENIMAVVRQLKQDEKSTHALERMLLNAAALADADSLRSILSELCASAVVSRDARDFTRLAQFTEAWKTRTDAILAPDDPAAATIWKPAQEAAILVVADEQSAMDLRIAAVRFLAMGPFFKSPQTSSLAALLTPRTAPELQSAAIAALKKDGSSLVAEAVLSDWSSREPRSRKESVGLLLSRSVWTLKLLQAIQDGTVSVTELDLPQQQSLLDHSDDVIRKTAAASFQPRTSAARQEAIARYSAAMNTFGDANEGRKVFQKHCSNCHRLQDMGHVVGPDIAGYSGKPLQSLLIAMLDPNQAIDPRYQSYVIVLNDGRSLTGIIAEEAASSLALLAAEGKRETVLRSEVEQIRSTGKSLMPEGFEQNATTTDINHLWAFFRTLSQPPKRIEGNQPAVVNIPPKGKVVLPASAAEIYGDDITFEVPFQNIGYWHGKDDFVRWRVHSEAARKFAVWAEWSCDENAAGNMFVVEGASPTLKGSVRSTGAWSRYQLVHLGTTLVREGESEIVMRPGEALRSALADLRAIHLVDVDGVPLATGMVDESTSAAKKPETAAEIASWLIDDQNSAADREKLIATHLSKAADVIPLMAKGLPAEAGSQEEYRRIPWIWRVAIAVGKAGDEKQIRGVLAASLPGDGQRLEHWQSVVIGGGLINGIGLAGQWPDESLKPIFAADKDLAKAWDRALQLSSEMADDESVPTGTRYDALRMVALRDWSVAREQIVRYLQKGVHNELQMGAVSGISDVRDAAVATELIAGYSHFSEGNRKLAIAALLRSEDRCLALLAALLDGHLPLELKQDTQVVELRKHSSPDVRMMAEQVLK